MFAVIDSGTTTTRIYIINDDHTIVASGRKQIGVRDTSITGSRDTLRNGIADLFFEILSENNIDQGHIIFAIASGMITSEIGLIEIPHLVAPVSLADLSEHIQVVTDPEVLSLGCPIYFVRGVRNNYSSSATIHDLRQIDFMRGEEVQCVGIMETREISYPCTIVALSSHTKAIYINHERQIAASNTTISGQFYQALISSTNIGKSITKTEGEDCGGYSYEEIVDIAKDCVKNAGLGRTCLMTRFMQVLLKTNSTERQLFIGAAIAADDMKAFCEMEAQGMGTDTYILYGQQERCELYTYMLKQEFGQSLKIESIYNMDEIDELTVKGIIKVALERIKRLDEANE